MTERHSAGDDYERFSDKTLAQAIARMADELGTDAVEGRVEFVADEEELAVINVRDSDGTYPGALVIRTWRIEDINAGRPPSYMLLVNRTVLLRLRGAIDELLKLWTPPEPGKND